MAGGLFYLIVTTSAITASTAIAPAQTIALKGIVITSSNVEEPSSDALGGASGWSKSARHQFQPGRVAKVLCKNIDWLWPIAPETLRLG